MNGFDLALFVVKTFFLSHAVLFGLVIGTALLVLSIIFLGTGPAIFAFLRSTIGQVIIALVVAGVIGWELKGYVDDSVAIERQLQAEKQKTREQAAITAAVQAQADEAKRQAEAAHATAEAAAARETQARTAAQDLQEQVDDYADELAQAAKRPAGAPGASCTLSDADARRLRGIGTAARKRS